MAVYGKRTFGEIHLVVGSKLDRVLISIVD